MRKIHLAIATMLTAAIGAVSAGSAVAAPVGPDRTPAMRDESFVERVSGVDVAQVASRTSASLDGVSITAPVNRTFRTADAMIAVLEEGQTEVRFGLPEGTTAAVSPEGGGTPGQVVLTDGSGRVAILGAPWAKDSLGVSLPTRYRIVGTELVQSVDTAGATFPVAADPKVTYSWMFTRKTVYFNKSETSRLNAGATIAAGVTAAVPGLNLVTRILSIGAAGAIALNKCIAITGTNTTFVPGAAVPFYYSGGYCR